MRRVKQNCIRWKQNCSTHYIFIFFLFFRYQKTWHFLCQALFSSDNSHEISYFLRKIKKKKNKMCLWNTNMSPGQGQFFFKVGHRSRSRSQVKIVCMSGKPLSQGTYMPNIKALSQTVQKLWPMLELSKQQKTQQTGQKQYVPTIATGDIKTECHQCYNSAWGSKFDNIYLVNKTLKNYALKGSLPKKFLWWFLCWFGALSAVYHATYQVTYFCAHRFISLYVKSENKKVKISWP